VLKIVIMKIVILLTGLVVLTAVAGIFAHQPAVKGRGPAETIIDEMVSGERAPNARVVRRLGFEAMPPLIRVLTLKDSLLKRGYYYLYSALPRALAGHLPEPQPAAHRRLNAAALAGQLGPPAQETVPALAKLLTDDLADVNAANSLGLIGPGARDAVPALIVAVEEQRPFAATALGELGPAALTARPALEAAARTGPAWQRREAELALKRLQRKAHRAFAW